MGLLHLSDGRGGALEGRVLILLPRKGGKHRGVQMPRIRLIVQNVEGHYGNSTHALLLYEGHMLVYDLAQKFSELVPLRGMSVSLTSVEFRLANQPEQYLPLTPTLNVSPQECSPLSLSVVGQVEMRLTQTVGNHPHPQTQKSGTELECGDWLHAVRSPPVWGRGSNMGRNYQWASPEVHCYGAGWLWLRCQQWHWGTSGVLLPRCEQTEFAQKINTDGNLDGTPSRSTMWWYVGRSHSGAGEPGCGVASCGGWWPGLGIYSPPPCETFTRR